MSGVSIDRVVLIRDTASGFTSVSSKALAFWYEDLPEERHTAAKWPSLLYDGHLDWAARQNDLPQACDRPLYLHDLIFF